ncbi:MAG: ECF transporter S component [Actinomycetota bacterium]|nr:ECF transporter S component [Actinomycetota bacterium]
MSSHAVSESTRQSRSRTARATPPLGRWRTHDLVTAALLAVATGVVFWTWNFAYAFLAPALTTLLAPLTALLGGTWFLAGVLGGLVIRRPGAAFFCELLAATVSALLGNEWGWTTVVSGIVQGLGAELVFAVLAYRRFGLPVAALAGAFAAVGGALYEWTTWLQGFDWAFKLVYLGCYALSGAVIAGIGGWLITRALARAGALNALPAGREALDHRAA